MNNDQQIEAAAEAVYQASMRGLPLQYVKTLPEIRPAYQPRFYELAEAALSAAHPTITTASELDALGPGAVVLDTDLCAWQEDRGLWLMSEDGPSIGGYKSTKVDLPATVLYWGEA